MDIVKVTWWFCGYCEVGCYFIGMATTGHLALFVILFVFVFGSITFSTDGNGTACFDFTCMSFVHLFVLHVIWEHISVLQYLYIFCMVDIQYLLYLRTFKLVALCRLLKFC